MSPEDRQRAQDAAWDAAAKAPVLNSGEARWVMHMLTEMTVLQVAVDAALDAVS